MRLMENNLAKKKMKKKLFLSIGIFCFLAAVFVVNSAFTSKSEIVVSSNTPFPQTGSISVYKFKFASPTKEKIGELQWSATTEKCYNDNWGDFTKVTLRVHNTTDEFIKTSFRYKGDNGLISFEVRPEDDFETTEICSASVTGVVPSQKEITLR